MPDASTNASNPPGFPDRTPWIIGTLQLPEKSWHGPVSRGLLRLAQRSARDNWALWRSFSAIRSDESMLMALARESTTPLRLDEHLKDQFELASAINMLAGAPSACPFALLLGHLGLELYLLKENSAVIRSICSVTRGLIEPKTRTPGFRLLLGGVSSLDQLAARMNLFDDSGEDIEHAGFRQLWVRCLRSRVTDLVAKGRHLRSLHAPSANDLNGLIAPETLTVDLDGSDPESESQTSASYLPETRGHDKLPSPSATLAIAKAHSLGRRGRAILSLDQDQVIPEPIARDALAAAEAAFWRDLSSGDIRQATRMMGVMLAMVVGASEAELATTELADSSKTAPVLSLNAGIFQRPEVRPDKAFTPPDGSKGPWLKTGGPICMALPPNVLKAAVALRHSMPSGGQFLFPRMDENGPQLPQVGLHSALSSALPNSNLTAVMFRQRLAAGIADALGSEAAQVMFGDSFGSSASSAFYGRWSVETLALAAWGSVASLQREDPKILPNSATLPKHWVGSRAAIHSSTMQPWIAAYRSDRRRAAQLENSAFLDAWRLLRDCLALLLLAGTGHRRDRAISELKLYDLIPEYCIAIFADKKVDPAHITRIAGVSARVQPELRRFIQFLDHCAKGLRGAPRNLARRILAAEAPLFSLPSDAGDEALDVERLFVHMPESVRPARHILRHRLNQQLILRHVDPEVRHQQFGWVLTNATATSDCSPNSAADFGKEISDALDACLLEDGWVAKFPSPPAWSWEGVDMPPLTSWAEALAAHQREHVAAQRDLRQALQTSRRDLLEKHQADLHHAIVAVVPELGIKRCKARYQLVLCQAGSPVEVTQESTIAILHLADAKAESAAASFALRAELIRLLRRARGMRVTTGFIPACLRLGDSTVPSPFLRNSGLAVRQTESIRQAILSGPASDSSKDVGGAAIRALMGILTHSPYRSLSLARQILQGARHATREAVETGCIRVPLAGPQNASHIVLTGIAAQAMMVMTGTEIGSTLLGDAAIAAWLCQHAPDLVIGISDAKTIVERLEQTVQVAGRIELSGPERLLMMGEVIPSTVSPERAIGRVDAWPARKCGVPAAVENEEPDGTFDAKPMSVVLSHGNRVEWREISNLLALLANDREQELPETGAQLAIRRGRKEAIIREAQVKLEKRANVSTAGQLILTYLCWLGTMGGKSGRRLRAATIANSLWRFAKPLVAITSDREFSDMTHEELESIYLAVLLSRSKRWRRRVLDGLRHFHWVVANRFELAEMEWAALAQMAGFTVDEVDAGILWDSEVAETKIALHTELAEIENSASADPRVLLLRQLRVVGIGFAEASGARPKSILGLTFGDLHLLPDGDYIQIRMTGDYGSAKTRASLGFVRLEGAAWQESREFVLNWVQSQQHRLGNAFLDCPIFGKFDELWTRHTHAEIFGRVNTLLRWASGESRARSYWLRKSRILKRHWALNLQPDALRARHVYRVLARSGHASVQTPLKSYLHDPWTHVMRHLRLDADVTRADTLTLTGWKQGALDQRIQRRRKAAQGQPAGIERMVDLIRAIGPPVAHAKPSISINAPPSEIVRHSLRLCDVDSWLRAMQRESGLLASRVAGIGLVTHNRLEALVAEFERRTAIGLCKATDVHVMKAPRRLRATNLPVIDSESAVDTDLAAMSEAWVQCAARAPLAAGWVVLTTEDRNRALNWLRAAGIQTIQGSQGRKLAKVVTLMPLRKPGGETLSASPTIWPQMSWLLLVHWMMSRLMETRDQSSPE